MPSLNKENQYRSVKRRRLGLKVLAFLMLALALVLCWFLGTKGEKGTTASAPQSGTSADYQAPELLYLAPTVLDQENTFTNAQEIDLSSLRDELLLTDGGNYHLTGTLEGTLLIQAKEQNVHLFFDNVSIHSDNGPALLCDAADKLVITLLPGTENYLSDSGYYPADSDAESCLYSDCDVTFNGTGALTVNAYYNDAIRSKDIVKILDGAYTVKCKDTGIRGNDGIAITGGTLSIASEKNGFKTTKIGADGRGSLLITGCEIHMIAGQYGINVNKADLYVYDCDMTSQCIVADYSVGGNVWIQEGCVH